MFLKELEDAEAARSTGNESMARVCSRRAAGVVIGEYFNRHAISSPSSSAYDRLKYLNALPGASETVVNITDHFLLRVNPDKSLPVDADLIEEAHWLARELLGEK